MKIVYRAQNVVEAEIIKGMLCVYGIDASIRGYYLQGGVGELVAMDSVQVCVSDEAVEEAMAIIADYEKEV